MGIFSYNQKRLQSQYKSNQENFAYGQDRVWNELGTGEKALSMFQEYGAKAKEMAVGIGKAAVTTGASFADVALRFSPVEKARQLGAGIKEMANPERSMATPYQAFQEGVTKSKARPLLFEKVTGKQVTNPDSSINWEVAREFIGSAAEAPMYAFAGGTEKVAGGLLKRLLTRTAKNAPLAGAMTGLQKFEEGTAEGTVKDFLVNALVLSGVSNIAGEIRLSKQLREETVKGVENEIGALSKEEVGFIDDALKQGVKSEEIITNLKKVKEGTVTSEEVANAVNKTNEETKILAEQTKTPTTTQKQELKPTKAASDVNKKLVAKGFDELPEQELAQYSTITKEQSINDVAVALEDWETAKKMALGQVDTGNLKKQVLYNAVVNKAEQQGDIELMRKLAQSPVATERSLLAQELGSAGYNKEPQTTTDYISELATTREKKVAERMGEKNIAPVRTKELSGLKKQIKKVVPTKETWDSFVATITCKE